MHENAFENGVCNMAAILSRPQCVNSGDVMFEQKGKPTNLPNKTRPYNSIYAYAYGEGLMRDIPKQTEMKYQYMLNN